MNPPSRTPAHDPETCGIDPVHPICPGCIAEAGALGKSEQGTWLDQEEIRQFQYITDVLAELIRDAVPADAQHGVRWAARDTQRWRETVRKALTYWQAPDMADIAARVRAQP